MSNLPDFEGLAIFAKVVQTHSFVGAAEELRLSKATVSKAVSRLEKKFGTRLFNRTARRLAVTEAGRQLYDRAAHILLEGEAAESEVIAQSALRAATYGLQPHFLSACSASHLFCLNFWSFIRTSASTSISAMPMSIWSAKGMMRLFG